MRVWLSSRFLASAKFDSIIQIIQILYSHPHISLCPIVVVLSAVPIQLKQDPGILENIEKAIGRYNPKELATLHTSGITSFF